MAPCSRPRLLNDQAVRAAYLDRSGGDQVALGGHLRIEPFGKRAEVGEARHGRGQGEMPLGATPRARRGAGGDGSPCPSSTAAVIGRLVTRF